MAADTAVTDAPYDPLTHATRTFHDTVPNFLDGADSPRALLERCLEVVEAREAEIMAFAYLNLERARAAADAAGERYRQRRPLSAIDGLPIGIKDLIETADMPTEYGSDLFRGNQPIRDAASVYALRQGGAVLVGKTETVCLGGGDPARTRNPFDTRRTPGGSSAGSAAAVGAAMLPAALGTHARGSTIRPASFCGIFALKPTFGALNRQGVFSAAHSMDHLGVLAGSLQDMWIVAQHIGEHAGGDPGFPGLYGADMAGWPVAEDAAKAGFEALLTRLAESGIEILSRGDDPTIDAYEDELADMPALWRQLYRFEMRWPLYQYRDYDESKLPPRLLKGLEEGDGLTRAQYREGLVKREYVRALHEEVARRADGLITLSSPGPGPIGMDQGSAIFNEASSVIGAPAISLPLLAVDGAPVGVQLLGPRDGDERLCASARWIAEHVLGRPA
jgi:Asp-tRNA(Asn)/Glu-tRNA(Gln) amidotransferase A subunit family amidase